MFIGEREIKEQNTLDEQTPAGMPLVEVVFTNDEKACYPQMMMEHLVSEQACDATALREKRVKPIVEALLAVLREYGLQTGDLPYVSALLNQSLDFNSQQALHLLWAEWMPHPRSADEVDLITIDRVLRAKGKKTLKDVLE